jgi:multiple sugar transport system permease protein
VLGDKTVSITRPASTVQPTAAPLKKGLRRRPGTTARRRHRQTGLLLVAPATVVALVLFIIPLMLMIWMSLSKWPLLGDHSFAGLANYRKIGSDATFKHSLVFTGIFTVIVTPALLLVGTALASFMNVSRPGVGLLRAVVFLPVVIGMASASYLWLWMLNPGVGLGDKILGDIGVTDGKTNWLASTGLALGAVTVMTIWKLAGFSMLVMLGGLQSVPEEVLEAAQLDGTNRLQLWLHVKLPLVKAQVALVTIFGLAGSYLAFDQFYIMTHGSPGTSTLTAVFSAYNASFVTFDLGYGSALSLIIMAILVVVSTIQLIVVRERD